jgi:Tol biopolymer transport system component
VIRLNLLVVAALLVCVGSARAATQPSRIVFAAAPVATAWGEIYRVRPDGSRIDLSKSPAADVAPAVSPDGKRVAFVSARGGHVRVYVVGIDGRGLRPLSPPLARAQNPDVIAALAWSPDGRTVAADLSVGAHPALFLAGPGNRWLRVAGPSIGAGAAWSADGARLADRVDAGLVAVANSRGRRLWSAVGQSFAWSKTGRLAVQRLSTTVDVYSAGGTHLSRFVGGAFAWSPDGRTLASMRGRVLEVRDGGVGKPRLEARVTGTASAPSVQFVTATLLRITRADGLWQGYDLVHRRRAALPPGLEQYGSIRSVRGATAFTTFGSATATQTVSLVIAGKTVATAPACHDDWPFWNFQFVGRTNALVYQSGCPVPSADLFAVAPDGSGLERLTRTPAHEFDPALSPDGAHVAYVEQPVADRCDGCAQSLWTTQPAARLTAPLDTDPEPFADRPTWSPDGSTIVFDRSGFNTAPHLVTIPAAGGAVTDLHVEGSDPAWGSKLIAFTGGGARASLQTLDPATGVVQTVAGGVDASWIAWSPTGRLAYVVQDAQGRSTIVVVGSPTRIRLSRLLPGARTAGLAWSPDGTRFAFTATDANGVGEIFTVRTDGEGLTRITKDIGALTFGSNLSWR